jgi:hypothetical protein
MCFEYIDNLLRRREWVVEKLTERMYFINLIAKGTELRNGYSLEI